MYTGKTTRRTTLPPGLSNATPIERTHPEDELEMYRQSPTTLTRTQFNTLIRIAKSIGIDEPDCIDSNWRRTWNIGRWGLSDKLFISANMIQPNLSVMWANVSGGDLQGLKDLSNYYGSLNLPSSSATLAKLGAVTQLKGRWTPYVIDTAIERGIVDESEVDITYANLSQSRLFFWLITEDGRRYFCTPTLGTLKLLKDRMPEWAKAITEVNAGNSLSIKPRSERQLNDARDLGRNKRLTLTHLTLNSEGWLQLVGNDSNVGSLYGALAYSIRRAIKSSDLSTFIESLVFKECD